MEEAGLEKDHVQEQHLNEQVLCDMSAGSRNHGRLAIGNGAVRVADVRAAAKERSVQPSNPVSMQSMAREMSRLRTANARLQQENHEKDNALQHYKVTIELALERKSQRMHCNTYRLPKQLPPVHLILAKSPLTTALMLMAMMMRASAEHTWMTTTIRVETMPLCDGAA
ncbi:unnamed protein product [Urochloa humidicola]